MNRKHRIIRTVVAGLATVAVGIAIVAVASSPHAADSAGVTPIDWIGVPLALAALWLVGLVLLGVEQTRDDGESGFVSHACPHCEREVLGRWRMCPYCGSRLEDAEPERHA